MKQIATALVKAQKEFGPALKTSTNPHFRSRYADLSACVEAVIDALNNNGIFLLQKNYDCADGIMVETVFVHESGEMLECGCLFFPAQKNDPQGFSPLTSSPRRRGSSLSKFFWTPSPRLRGDRFQRGSSALGAAIRFISAGSSAFAEDDGRKSLHAEVLRGTRSLKACGAIDARTLRGSLRSHLRVKIICHLPNRHGLLQAGHPTHSETRHQTARPGLPCRGSTGQIPGTTDRTAGAATRCDPHDKPPARPARSTAHRRSE